MSWTDADKDIVVGYAGTGKSATLSVAREAWEAAGYEVRGIAPPGSPPEVGKRLGIASRTIASMEYGWGQGRDTLTARDVLVIDEAGMVRARTISDRVLSHAAEARPRSCMAMPQQLQSIEAGAAFADL